MKKEVIEEFQKIYNIQDTNIVLRLLNIKAKLANERNVNMNNDELFDFLNYAMNFDEMQIWLIRMQLEGEELTLNDELKKFFELKTDDEILVLYDIGQNINEESIENARKLIKKRKN